ncbi:choice-of-anchor D domain-containing protein [candidate division KSB1 bacterium]|nr:choice-of-anchor D domain-containing protein [candidate division KSB1 bacterium]
MKGKDFYPVLGFLFTISSLYAQSVIKEAWVRHYGAGSAPAYMVAQSLRVDFYGNIWVTGSGGDTLKSSRDYVTIAYDRDGGERWIRLYQGIEQGQDEGQAILKTKFGPLCVTGLSQTAINTFNYTTLSYHDDGQLDWKTETVPFPTTANIGASIESDPNLQNFWIAGMGTHNYVIYKYDFLGNLIWHQSGVDYSCESVPRIVINSAGNLYLTCKRNQDYFLVKYDALGLRVNECFYNGPANGDDLPTAIVSDQAGNIYVTGRSSGMGTGDDFTTLKYDAHLNLCWITRYNHGADDAAIAVTIDSSTKDICVAGRSWDSETLNDFTIVKYDQNGNEKWLARYHEAPTSDDWPQSMTMDRAGNIYVTGWSRQADANQVDFLTLKYDPNGNLQWAQRYAHPHAVENYARDLVVDDSANVYVTGNSRGNGWSVFTTIKYQQPVEDRILISPQSVDFGAVLLGEIRTCPVTISNPGSKNHNLWSNIVGAYQEFTFTPNDAYFPAASSYKFQLQFKPVSMGLKYAQIILWHTATGSPDTIAARGDAKWFAFSAEPDIIDFGTVLIATTRLKSFQIQNRGNLDFNISISNPLDSIYRIQPETTTLAPANNQTFTVIFQPQAVQNYDASLDIKISSQCNQKSLDTSRTIILKGEGTPFKAEPAILHFNSVLLDSMKIDSVRITNRSQQSIRIDSVSHTYSVFQVAPDSGTLRPGASLTFVIGFMPDATTFWVDELIFYFMMHHLSWNFKVELWGAGHNLYAVKPGPTAATVFDFDLFPNVPNPFNPTTQISYQLPRASEVVLKIFNLQGQEIRTLVCTFESAGKKNIIWDGTDARGNQVAAGIYLCQLQAGSFVKIRKMLLVN